MSNDDLVVIVPAGVALTACAVTGTGGDAGGETSTTITTADGLSIATVKNTGIRYSEHGWMGSDLRIQDTAKMAAWHALMAGVRDGLPATEARERVLSANEESRRLGELVLSRGDWTVDRIDVDGDEFAVFELTIGGRFAAVADLGAYRIAFWGERALSGPALSIRAFAARRRSDLRAQP